MHSHESNGLVEQLGRDPDLDVEILIAVASLLTSEDSDAREGILAALTGSLRSSTAMRTIQRVACGVVLISTDNSGVSDSLLHRASVAVERICTASVRGGNPPGRLFDAYNGVLGGLRDSHLSIVDLSTDVQIRGPHLGSCTNAIVSPAVFHPRFASALARQSMLRLGSDVRLRVGRRVEHAIDLGLGIVETVGGVPVETCRLVRLHGVLQQGDSFRQAAMHMRTVVVGCRDQQP